ncbi:hypothetical protein ACFCV3_42055 [Kribbella sp. NPDC056345]|uniref:hypothetical protein n=1 Tax=Kribbella sp. NPDC056345 TaxID=3345789 RepID=UPI0035E1825D
MAAVIYYGPVTLDGKAFFQGHYDPVKRWNGNLCPSFDRAEAEQVAEWMNYEGARGPKDLCTWDGDTFVYDNPDSSDDPERFEPDESGHYAIGAGSWYWGPPITDFEVYGPVTVDGLIVATGYYDPEAYRIFPSFDRKQAERIAEQATEHDPESTLFEWDGDVLVYTQLNYPDEEPERIRPDGYGRYIVGRNWDWERDD